MQVSSQHCRQVGQGRSVSSSGPRWWVAPQRHCMDAPKGTVRFRRSMACRCPAIGHQMNERGYIYDVNSADICRPSFLHDQTAPSVSGKTDFSPMSNTGDRPRGLGIAVFVAWVSIITSAEVRERRAGACGRRTRREQRTPRGGARATIYEGAADRANTGRTRRLGALRGLA